MKEKDIPVKFNLIGINTEEFARFDENLINSKNFNHKIMFGFGIDETQKVILATYEINAFSDKGIILKGKFNFAFRIADESWDSLKKKNKLIIPKGFLDHISVISIGTIRGILYEKLHNLQSPLSSYLFPLADITQNIEKDVEFKLEN